MLIIIMEMMKNMIKLKNMKKCLNKLDSKKLKMISCSKKIRY